MRLHCTAEIGGNHTGRLRVAERMIEVIARYCTESLGLERPSGMRPVVKFQKRTPALRPDDFVKSHPEPYHAYGRTYGEHRAKLEFDAQEHARLKDICEAEGVGYACSVWDIPAADAIIPLEPEWLKIPSAHNSDYQLLDYVFSNWGGEVHISTGMATRSELLDLVEWLGRYKERVVLYACVGDYPVSFKDACVAEVEYLGRFGFKAVGLSGHHNGIALDIAALAFGATHFERHFTLNRTWRGTDHAASLEPDGFRRLMRDLHNVALALRRKDDLEADGLLECEKPMRAKLKCVSTLTGTTTLTK